jgi:hypothetical protein
MNQAEWGDVTREGGDSEGIVGRKHMKAPTLVIQKQSRGSTLSGTLIGFALPADTALDPPVDC